MPRKTDPVKRTENDLDLADVLTSWKRHLSAERKSPQTIRTYEAGVGQFIAWLAETGRPASLDVDTVIDWTNHLLQTGSPATALSRQASVRRLSAWAASKGITGPDQLGQVRPPKVDEALIEGLTPAQLKALLATCDGKDFRHVRDIAIIRFMCETGTRASEVTAMTTADIDLDRRIAIVRRGKGGRGRLVPFSPQCAAAVDDYLRARRKHQRAKAGSDALWLGESGRGLGYWGLYSGLTRRGEAAGIRDMHPHRLRHTAAIRWLDKGGSPTGLMAVAGWSSVDMLRRYIRAAEGELAAGEADRLNLGDL
jgi:site-specific recombinase XerD